MEAELERVQCGAFPRLGGAWCVDAAPGCVGDAFPRLAPPFLQAALGQRQNPDSRTDPTPTLSLLGGGGEGLSLTT